MRDDDRAGTQEHGRLKHLARMHERGDRLTQEQAGDPRVRAARSAFGANPPYLRLVVVIFFLHCFGFLDFACQIDGAERRAGPKGNGQHESAWGANGAGRQLTGSRAASRHGGKSRDPGQGT